MPQKLMLIVAVALLPSLAFAAEDVASLKARIAELERENEALKAELAAMRGELKTVQTAKAELETQQAEQREQRQAMYIVSQYDPKAGKTRLVSKPVALDVSHGSRAGHYLQLTAEGTGRNDKNPTFTMTVSAYAAGRIYHVAKNLELTVDGQSMVLPIVNYERDKKMTGSPKNRTDRSDEYLTFRLTADQVRQIGKASAVTGRAGSVRYKFSNNLIRLFSAAAESIDH